MIRKEYQTKIHKQNNQINLKNKLDLALLNHRNGELDKAILDYEFYFARNENNPVCNTNLAILYKTKKRVDKAISLYEKTIKNSPQFLNTYINYSSLLLELKNYNKSLEVVKKGLLIDSQNTSLLINKSLVFYFQEQFDNSKKEIKKALALEPNKFNTRLILFNLEHKFKNKKYIDDFLNELFDKKNFSIEKINLAIFKSRVLNNTLLSIKICEKLILIRPHVIEHKSNLIGFLREASLFDKALELCKKFEAQCKLDENFFINYGAIYFDVGNLKAAEEVIKNFLKVSPNSAAAQLTLGTIYKEKGFLEKAEKYTRLALKNNPKIDNGMYNLASIMQDSGNSAEALKIILKIKNHCADTANINTLLANIYISLGDLKSAKKYLIKAVRNNQLKRFKCNFLLSLFKEDDEIKNDLDETLKIPSNTVKNQLNKVDLLFAKANILHSRKKYNKALNFLVSANNIKRKMYPSNLNYLKSKSKELIDLERINNTNLNLDNLISNIFIVGMPRCGSTLLESILTTNKELIGLGETLNIEKIFNSKGGSKNLDIDYKDHLKIKNLSTTKLIDKQLYNYIFSGFILRNINNSRIIHCIRNPIDNFLSIYKTHFLSGNRFSSSIEDCVDLYLDHLETINFYKKLYKNYIYTLCYDELVISPEKEIKSLITWLNFEWNNNYLEHQKFSREIQTASKIQARAPINYKSLENWKNYKNYFKSILGQNKKFLKIIELTNDYKFNLDLN